MNIFYLHRSPSISAKAMTNKHIVKMILESGQMLCTAHHELDGEKLCSPSLYKSTHKNHPSAKWVRESKQNYSWLYQHMLALGLEYTKRYGKTHKTIRTLSKILMEFPKNLDYGKFTEPPQAMPDEYKDESSLVAYRRYYLSEKIKNQEDLMRYNSVIHNEREVSIDEIRKTL